MFIKFCTDFFSKNLFFVLIAASLAIHGIIIFLSPQTSQILSLRSFRDSFIREPNDYTVTLNLEDSDMSKETSERDAKQNKREIEEKNEKEPEKKQHKIFIDTSDNKEDEESTIESDKIGEKGSLAKDYFPNDKQPINNEPHAGGHSTAPLLGKGGSNLPGDGKSQPQVQVVAPQPLVSVDSHQDRNIPPKYANLPKGIEKQGEPVTPVQVPQNQMFPQESKVETPEAGELAKTNTEVKPKNAGEIPRKEQQASGRSVQPDEEEGLPLSSREGVLFTEKKDDITNTSKTDEKELPDKNPLEKKEEDKTAKEEIETHEEKKTKELKETREREVVKETKSIVAHKEEMVVPPSESPGAEPQRTRERGLDEQESPGEVPKPKVSINVNAKKEGSGNDPVLFEDTISNAEISGMPSFNVKKHEYADYFKYIRDTISLFWFLGYGTRAEIKLETKDDKPIIVEFKVLPDGSIADAKIVDDAGNFSLASRLLSSINNAAPLKPFPAKIKEPSIDVRFNFYFL